MKKLIPVFILFFVGCKTPDPIVLHDSTSVGEQTSTEDTYTYTEVDSLLYSFLFECDSNYNVLMKEYENLNTGIREVVTVKEVPKYYEDKTRVNRLRVDITVLVDSIAILNRTVEKLKNTQRIINVPVPGPTKFVKENTQFAKFCVKFFFIVIFVGIVYIVYRLKIWKIKI